LNQMHPSVALRSGDDCFSPPKGILCFEPGAAPQTQGDAARILEVFQSPEGDSLL